MLRKKLFPALLRGRGHLQPRKSITSLICTHRKHTLIDALVVLYHLSGPRLAFGCDLQTIPSVVFSYPVSKSVIYNDSADQLTNLVLNFNLKEGECLKTSLFFSSSFLCQLDRWFPSQGPIRVPPPSPHPPSFLPSGRLEVFLCARTLLTSHRLTDDLYFT